ncbi:ferredoxin--NADP(+) reductase [Buchnera aphidicola (Pemphigus obesinymphae)]|uniref:FAD-binding oxidoreductase n=1 Tax=Buchnera aphidicola TaxID=9 RepID=UPI0022388B69|nr:FAD-binding oxidoreductase [Buchnera aphidicola]MCW5196796.1 ferredoxin--NADP(+) reductase [Buchnera aphidicola (Pemphigus obesinymphae)]
MTQWITGKIIKIKKWNSHLFSIILNAPIAPFIAGQFVKLSFKNEKKIQRAYSYVNAPDNKNLEFYIILVKSGEMTNRLYNLIPNDEILITKEASGFFTISEIPECKNLWMFATGTGIGPYLSILQDKKDKIKKFKNIILIHAVRYINELNYTPLINKLKKKHEGKLHIHTIVSREKTDNSLMGRIPNLIKNKELENKVGLELNSNCSHVMLCGNPNMVRDTQKILLEIKNMRKHYRRNPGHITSENYW